MTPTEQLLWHEDFEQDRILQVEMMPSEVPEEADARRALLDRIRADINQGMRAMCANRYRRAAELRPIDDEIARLQELRASYGDVTQGRLEELEDWVIQLFAAHRRIEGLLTDRPAATLRTPWGEVTSRTADRWDWPETPEDVVSLVEILQSTDHDELIRYTAAPDKTAIKASGSVNVDPSTGKVVLGATGEILPIFVSRETTIKPKPVGPDCR